jgi:hypothetical protein
MLVTIRQPENIANSALRDTMEMLRMGHPMTV